MPTSRSKIHAFLATSITLALGLLLVVRSSAMAATDYTGAVVSADYGNAMGSITLRTDDGSKVFLIVPGRFFQRYKICDRISVTVGAPQMVETLSNLGKSPGCSPATPTPTPRWSLAKTKSWFSSNEVVRCFPFIADGLFITHEDALNGGYTMSPHVSPKPWKVQESEVKANRVASASSMLPSADTIYQYRASHGFEDGILLQMTADVGFIEWLRAENEHVVIGYVSRDAHAGLAALPSSPIPLSTLRLALSTKRVSVSHVPEQYRQHACGMTAVRLLAPHGIETLTVVIDSNGQVQAAISEWSV